MKKTVSNGNAPESGGGFTCYIGPSVAGVISRGEVFTGSREWALKAAGALLEKVPEAASLLVPGDKLAGALCRAEEPGSALFRACEKVREMGKEAMSHA